MSQGTDCIGIMSANRRTPVILSPNTSILSFAPFMPLQKVDEYYKFSKSSNQYLMMGYAPFNTYSNGGITIIAKALIPTGSVPKDSLLSCHNVSNSDGVDYDGPQHFLSLIPDGRNQVWALDGVRDILMFMRLASFKGYVLFCCRFVAEFCAFTCRLSPLSFKRPPAIRLRVASISYAPFLPPFVPLQKFKTLVSTIRVNIGDLAYNVSNYISCKRWVCSFFLEPFCADLDSVRSSLNLGSYV